MFKGAINPRHTYIYGFKHESLWYETWEFMVWNMRVYGKPFPTRIQTTYSDVKNIDFRL